MSAYEVALLVATALFVCILLWDNHKIRGRLERSEADIAWLKRAMHNTIKVHQETLDRHTKHLEALNGKVATANRGVERLEEQTAKTAARFQSQLEGVPAAQRVRADVDRLLKADMMRRRPQFMNSDRQYAAERAEEARRERDGVE